MTLKKKALEDPKKSKHVLAITNDKLKTQERQFAETGLSAPTLNAVTARNFVKPLMGEIDITETVLVMHEKVAKIKAGDLSDLEATLAAQVVTLDTIFNELARRAGLNMGQYMSAAETYMRLALKAQAQTARTVEVLAAMKNPPVVFAKQANIAHGHQQVNNANNTPAPARTGKTVNQENELLEVDHGSKTMDTRTAQATIAKDKAMATVDTLDRG